ncbi:hypothetical protein IWX50DRAFT_207654 [Phyllosticta citricarpa]|uniref:Uncharacterized protein n=1 Tax=Phyllosticta citricarpa TaxID=55181 RepID=A0ABR1MTF7_9PEZI
MLSLRMLSKRLGDSTRSPSSESSASPDSSESESESPQQTSQLPDESNSSSTSNRQSKDRSIFSTSVGRPLGHATAKNHKILKGVARKGYYEDVYDAYPSTDEDREGGSIPCESDSDDGPPTLSPRRRKKEKSKLAKVESRREEERVLAQAFEKRLNEFDPEKPDGRCGIFGRVQPSASKSASRERSQETGLGASATKHRNENQEDDEVEIALAEFRQGKTFLQSMTELEEVFKSNSRLPNRYRRLCRWWKGCDEPVAPEKMAWHWRHMEEILKEDNLNPQDTSKNASKDTSPLSSLPTTTPEAPSAPLSSGLQPAQSAPNISLGTKGLIDPQTGEIMIPPSALKEKSRQLYGGFSSRTEIAHNTDEPNDAEKSANEGPPEEGCEPPAKKLRNDSGENGGEIHGRDLSPVENESYKNTARSRAGSVPDKVRRSKRQASNNTPFYRADQHPADAFLGSLPKVQAETSFIHITDSDDEDEDKDEDEEDEPVTRWPRKGSLVRPVTPPRPKTPPKPKPTESTTSRVTPKRRGRRPGTRVINGKVVLPSEEVTPSAPKSVKEPSSKASNPPTSNTTPVDKKPKSKFDEPTITSKRTPIPSEKDRANTVHAAATKKAPAQSKVIKGNIDAPKSKTTAAQSKSTKVDTSTVERKPPATNTAALEETRRENGFIRGNTDFEEDSSTDADTMCYGEDDGKEKSSFRLPSRRPTPPYPASSGSLNRRLFR